jgi:hypothetical protein
MRGCVKSISPPSAAKESFEWTSFFLISLREIRKNDVHSKYNLAAPAAKESFEAFYTTPESFRSAASAANNGLWSFIWRLAPPNVILNRRHFH